MESRWFAASMGIGVAQAVVNIVTDLSICLAMLWTLFRARIRVRGDSV
jgi:hypothetical protein